MFYEPVIRVNNLNKCYQLYAQPHDRLKQFLWRGRRKFYREFWALRNISFEIMPGEVIGIIGRNGSGKSTLLQLICGTLTPSHGKISVNGRVAALLELGAGFNPEFSGRENVWMNASILGLSDQEIADKFEDIVDFSGIRDFIDQPVKTYSSGMYVRLAFAVATSIDPDILVIDEALSVGDGAFARKSFDRIMALKNAGKTILFCSHSLYQVEAICDKVMWLNQGEMTMLGAPDEVTMAYEKFLIDATSPAPPAEALTSVEQHNTEVITGSARIVSVTVTADGVSGKRVPVRSMESDLTVRIEFVADICLPPPNLAVSITTEDGRGICMVGSQFDNFLLQRDEMGRGLAEVVFPAIALARGNFFIDVFLGCENSIHIYDTALKIVQLNVSQTGKEQGIVKLPHHWVGQKIVS